MNERNAKDMNDQDFVSAITGNTGDSGWRNMVPQVDSSDFPTQWMPSALECSIIDAQAKEIEKLRRKVPRWIPVEERLPENGVRVLAFNMRAKNKYIGIWTREKDPGDGNDCWFDSAGWWYAFDEITHWMPLPTDPEVENA
nr:MAG TPA: Protein of unknown function (DUF551) [Caudoviricetes sp.]